MLEEEEEVEEVKLYDFDWTVPPEMQREACYYKHTHRYMTDTSAMTIQ